MEPTEKGMSAKRYLVGAGIWLGLIGLLMAIYAN
jgi:hypothetical protein